MACNAAAGWRLCRLVPGHPVPDPALPCQAVSALSLPLACMVVAKATQHPWVTGIGPQDPCPAALQGALRVLRVFGLPNLLQVHILLPATAPLKILELGRCPQLHTVKVNAAHMEVFSASDCERLTTVQLRTPQLLNLTLALARRLSEVSLEVACPELLHLNVSGCRNLMWEGELPLSGLCCALFFSGS